MDLHFPKFIWIARMDDSLILPESIGNLCNDIEYFTPTKSRRNDVSSPEASQEEIETSVPVPMEISAATTEQKQHSDESILSPSSSTRNQLTRKRSTPEKYVPFSANTTSIAKKKKSIRPPSTNSSKKKSSETVEDIESLVVIQDTVPVLSDDQIMQLERDAVAKRLLAENDQDNLELANAADAANDLFLRSLLKITRRNASNISWGGFVLGYMREIRLNDFGKEYYKTSKYYYFLIV
jgi:hypothetical protein